MRLYFGTHSSSLFCLASHLETLFLLAIVALAKDNYKQSILKEKIWKIGIEEIPSCCLSLFFSFERQRELFSFSPFLLYFSLIFWYSLTHVEPTNLKHHMSIIAINDSVIGSYNIQIKAVITTFPKIGMHLWSSHITRTRNANHISRSPQILVKKIWPNPLSYYVCKVCSYELNFEIIQVLNKTLSCQFVKEIQLVSTMTNRHAANKIFVR